MAALISSRLQVTFFNHLNNLLYTQVISEIGGHILDMWSMDENKGGKNSHKLVP